MGKIDHHLLSFLHNRKDLLFRTASKKYWKERYCYKT
jgi:hypothetical protein